jgi:hypothetical protein
MSKIPYDDFKKDIKDNSDTSTDHTENFYRHLVFTLFYAMSLNLQAEVHGNLGRSDLELVHEGQAWVFEIKISYNEKDDARKAEAALNQIIEEKYGVKYQKSVFLGLAINDKARKITAWKCQGGLFTDPNEAAAGTKKQDSESAD